MKKIRPSRIIEGTVKNLTGSNTESSLKRYETCKGCDNNVKGVCNICFCPVKSKSKVFIENCPINMWHDIKTLKKAGIAIAIKNPEKATLTVDEDSYSFVFDYGAIKKGDNTKLHLVLVNDRGNYFNDKQDLNNVGMMSTCSCTVSTKLPKTIKEGQSFDLDVSYNSKIVGVFSKKLNFTSDEITFKINLKGEVK